MEPPNSQYGRSSSGWHKLVRSDPEIFALMSGYFTGKVEEPTASVF